MDSTETPARADDGPDRQGHAHLLLGQEPVLGRLVDQAVHRQREEVAEHDLHDRPESGHSRAKRGTRQGELRDGSVEHALRPILLVEPRRRREDAAGDCNVLAEENDSLVRGELFVERVANRGAESDASHQATSASGRCSSSRSRERKRAASAP